MLHRAPSFRLLALFVFTSLAFWGCKEGSGSDTVTNFFFTLEDDKKMGKQTADQIAADPATYPVLSETAYPEAYGHLKRIRDNVLASGKVEHRSDFEWQVKIIRDDSTLNAFCTPGGYIYVYTGIIKYLDNETQLAGVMGHEIAHADRRHSVKQMLQIYGVQTLLAAISGSDDGLATQLGTQLIGLKFSRDHETEADNYSVTYLCPTEYDARGAKYFFEKIGSSGTPTFLSTHPSPPDRVENIQKQWQDNCNKTGQTFDSRYASFKASLP